MSDERASGAAPRTTRTGLRRLVPTWRVIFGGALLLLLGLGGAFMAGYLLVHIPPANASATAQSNIYLYSDGTTEIAREGVVNRENVPLSQVPRDVQEAVLAAEDRKFYRESAVDPLAMARAAWNTVNGRGVQSGSTITQQFVKNYYLNQQQTIRRKAEEFFIAIKLDREQTKDQILQGYLNTSYFGRGAYGIQAAAQAYYGVDVSKLTTAQDAYLAALLNAPSHYDVVTDPPARADAIGRWNYVLDGMVKEGWLSRHDRAGMTFPEPGRIKGSNGLSGQRGYLVEAVKQYLINNKIIDERTLAAGGYRITTTIQKLKEDAMVNAAGAQLMSKLSGSNPVDRYVRVGGVSIDPADGEVVALYGGVDFTKQYVNNATRRDYQVGSTFKPFVFASAVQNGSATQDGRPITPETGYDGTDGRPVQGPGGPVNYAPANEDNRSFGNITVSEATNQSVNAVYAQMAEDVGPDKVKSTAVEAGIPASTPGLSAYPSIALGVATASPLDMAQGYTTLDNHGKYIPYTFVSKIIKGTEAVALRSRQSSQNIPRQAADTTTSMLENVVNASDGTGTAAQAAGVPAAGKTGTAEQDMAAWFAGYTPNLVTVVAVMGQDPDSGKHEQLYGATGLSRVNGGGYPTQIWAAYTGAALRGQSVPTFDLRLQSGAGLSPSASPPPSSGPPSGFPFPPVPPSSSSAPTSPPPTPGWPAMSPVTGGLNGGFTQGTTQWMTGATADGGATGGSPGGSGGTSGGDTASTPGGTGGPAGAGASGGATEGMSGSSGATTADGGALPRWTT